MEFSGCKTEGDLFTSPKTKIKSSRTILFSKYEISSNNSRFCSSEELTNIFDNSSKKCKHICQQLSQPFWLVSMDIKQLLAKRYV